MSSFIMSGKIMARPLRLDSPGEIYGVTSRAMPACHSLSKIARVVKCSPVRSRFALGDQSRDPEEGAVCIPIEDVALTNKKPKDMEERNKGIFAVHRDHG